MAVDRFFTPSVVVKNISNKAVRLIGQVTIKPGQTLDLYESLDISVELFEDQILKNLERPNGDLYRESQIKRSIVIQTLVLTSFHYSIVSPSNINAINNYAPGLIPSAIDDELFQWVSTAGITVDAPLQLSGSVISIPPATGAADGFLAKEDWARFDASVKGAMRIWQYQDFAAPVGGSVTITAFENGSGLAFNAGYILDGTASVVLVSDTSRPPTTTLAFPASLLPSNRVIVSSHIGTTAVFNSTPESTLNVRVFYLISLPATAKLPNDYQEDPEFLNDSSLDYLDDLYVNQNEDEVIYGAKTFSNAATFDGALKYTVNPVDGYYLKSDAAGNAIWAEVVATGGTGATNLNELTDVDLITTTPFVGALLGFDGYLWVPLEGNTMYNKEIDEIASGDLYIGEALPGTATSEAKWRIQFVNFTKTGSLEDVSIAWQSGTATFTAVWDDRLSLSYS